MNKKNSILLTLVLVLAIASQPLYSASADTIPVTGNLNSVNNAVRSLAPFAASVAISGNPNLVAGIFARDLFAAPVVQQPAAAPGFVSRASDTATQFSMAATYGSVALLAHNDLLGESFFAIPVGKILTLVYGDGHARTYRVKQILRYQALTPNSPYSDFLDIDDPAADTISVETLFYKVYAQAGRLVLQTCIAANGDSSWGRIFIIAEPENLMMKNQVTRLFTQPTQRLF